MKPIIKGSRQVEELTSNGAVRDDAVIRLQNLCDELNKRSDPQTLGLNLVADEDSQGLDVAPVFTNEAADSRGASYGRQESLNLESPRESRSPSNPATSHDVPPVSNFAVGKSAPRGSRRLRIDAARGH